MNLRVLVHGGKDCSSTTVQAKFRLGQVAAKRVTTDASSPPRLFRAHFVRGTLRSGGERVGWHGD